MVFTSKTTTYSPMSVTQRAVRTSGFRRQPAVEMINVCRDGVENLSLVVEQGEICGIFGPPSSGKTTVINLLSGIWTPQSGKITVMGRGLSRHLFGVVPQVDANTLDETYTAYEHLHFHANLIGLPKRSQCARINKTLAEVQLIAYSQLGVHAFSRAMKCRLAIARALLHDPAILYLDEPTLGTYGQARHALWHDLYLLSKRGKTIVLATADWEEAQTFCNRLVLLKNHGQ